MSTEQQQQQHPAKNLVPDLFVEPTNEHNREIELHHVHALLNSPACYGEKCKHKSLNNDANGDNSPATTAEASAPLAFIVDTRSRDEYNASHIPNAVNVPFDEVPDAFDSSKTSAAEFEQKYGFQRPEKQTPIVVHCFTGMRAAKAVAALEQRGYTHVKRYSAGMRGWAWSKLPAVLLQAPETAEHAAVPFDVVKHVVEVDKSASQPMICGFPPVLLLDVRSPEEFKNGSISDVAKNIPLPELEAALALDDDPFSDKYGFWKPNQQQPIIVYCHSGARAKRALAVLRAAGFARARVYEGSMRHWNQEKAAEKIAADDNSTDKTHVSVDTVKEAAAMPGLLVLDVRTPAEVAAKPGIPGSVNIPATRILDDKVFDSSKFDSEAFEKNFGFSLPPKSQPIVCYCSGGDCKLATVARDALVSQGYSRTKVFDFAAWQDS